MPDKSINQNGTTRQGAGPQLVQKPTKKGSASAATAMNQHIKAAVIRLTVDSPLEFRTFRNIAKYAGTREDQAIAVLREYVRDLRAQVPPQPPRTPTPIRRAA